MWSRGILRKLGTRLNRSTKAEFFFNDSGYRKGRPITGDSHCLRYIIKWCSKVSLLFDPIPFVWKKGKEKKEAARKFPFLSLYDSPLLALTINLFSVPLLSFPYLGEIEAGFDQERQPAKLRYGRIVERRSEEGEEESWGKFRADESNRPSPKLARSLSDLWRGISSPDRDLEWIIFGTVDWFWRFDVSFARGWKSSSSEIRNTSRWMEEDGWRRSFAPCSRFHSSRYFGKETIINDSNRGMGRGFRFDVRRLPFYSQLSFNSRNHRVTIA